MEPDVKVVSMLSELVTKQEIIVAEDTALLTKYRNALSELLGSSKITKEPAVKATQSKTIIKHKLKAKPKVTTSKDAKLLDKIIFDYIDGVDDLKPANDLREEYNAKTGKNINANGFYAKLNQLKERGVIVLHKIDGNPIASKFLYSIDRFRNEDGILKPEYLEKAKAPQDMKELL